MTILHIEHPVSDYDVWLAAFDRFAAARGAAGVRAHHIFRPVDDDRYVIVHLDLPDVAAASAFRDVLRTRIWTDASASPALRGEPRATILRPA